ncbi:MAG: hypothetical protein H0W53_08395 [Acidobacteria bacterium]|nr:hypothetical protein [Acidobacteriota bacterium]
MRGATASAMGTGLGTALATAIVVVLTGAFVTVSDARDAAPVTLTFERVDRIGGHQTTILGSPRVVVTPIGTAVEFDGVDDALLMHVHPLAGWENRMLFEICVVDDFHSSRFTRRALSPAEFLSVPSAGRRPTG